MCLGVVKLKSQLHESPAAVPRNGGGNGKGGGGGRAGAEVDAVRVRCAVRLHARVVALLIPGDGQQGILVRG